MDVPAQEIGLWWWDFLKKKNLLKEKYQSVYKT
jgi:hypothetical protein